jgi:hypothetical protein
LWWGGGHLHAVDPRAGRREVPVVQLIDGKEGEIDLAMTVQLD